MVVSYFNNTALIICCQVYPNTIPPIRLGIKNTVLKRLVPLIFLVNNNAIENAHTLISIIATIVKLAVNNNALTKSLLSVKALT